ncbi:15240_t:CDS:2 [Acaulospora morrowiae]|uniref:15240_t:CDS:1 n=1 Tax=Acaulospora morrowiae TaxID=94023 RepID=A0A9N8WUA2_9GLOM|nr:15240_t:CDS:2 [Acaulospora morrowiae]
MVVPKGSNVVKIENIPYGVNEETLKGVFQKVGPVASFRIAFDKEGGPEATGYGFCEYYDSPTATNAMQNFNDLEIDDRRLKVHVMNCVDPPSALSESRSEDEGGSIFSQAPRNPEMSKETLKQTPVESITSKTGMNGLQLIDALITLKMLFERSEAQAKELLNSNPRLSHDMFVTLLEHNLVEKELLQRVNTFASQKANIATTPFLSLNANAHGNINSNGLLAQQQDTLYRPSLQLTQQTMHYQPTLSHFQQNSLQIPVQQTPNLFSFQQYPLQVPTQQSHSRLSIQHPQHDAITNVGNTLDTCNFGERNAGITADSQIREQNAALILKILNLTQQQIDLFPPEERNRIIQLAKTSNPPSNEEIRRM